MWRKGVVVLWWNKQLVSDYGNWWLPCLMSETKQGVGQHFFTNGIHSAPTWENLTIQQILLSSVPPNLLCLLFITSSLPTVLSSTISHSLSKWKHQRRDRSLLSPTFSYFGSSSLPWEKGWRLTNPCTHTVPHRLMLSLGQPFFVLSGSFSKVGVGGKIRTMKNEKWILTCKQL